MTAEYTIKDANNVAVHNYAIERGANNEQIIHDVNLCAYVRDPTNNPGALAVAPCGVPSVGSDSDTKKDGKQSAAHQHESPLHKLNHLCMHAYHALHTHAHAHTSSSLARTGSSITVRTCHREMKR